jgi:hypothetical protein
MGITLVGFLRDEAFNVYTHRPQRRVRIPSALHERPPPKRK